MSSLSGFVVISVFGERELLWQSDDVSFSSSYHQKHELPVTKRRKLIGGKSQLAHSVQFFPDTAATRSGKVERRASVKGDRKERCEVISRFGTRWRCR